MSNARKTEAPACQPDHARLVAVESGLKLGQALLVRAGQKTKLATDESGQGAQIVVAQLSHAALERERVEGTTGSHDANDTTWRRGLGMKHDVGGGTMAFRPHTAGPAERVFQGRLL